MRGRPQGDVKYAKWAKNKKNEKIGKNRQKIIQKNEIVPDFLLKSLPLPSTQLIMAKKKEKVSQGGPWQCAIAENTI